VTRPASEGDERRSREPERVQGQRWGGRRNERVIGEEMQEGEEVWLYTRGLGNRKTVLLFTDDSVVWIEKKSY